jgi:hypothetical protein
LLGRAGRAIPLLGQLTQHSIVQEAPVVASFNGAPTDIAYRDNLAAVVDSNGSASHVSIFDVDGDGNFSPKSSVTINSAATNGIAIVRADDLDE